MIIRLGLVVGLLWAQTGSYDPNEVIGEDETTVPTVQIPRQDEAIIRVNGEPFTWQDPLIINGGRTYSIHITGLKPHSKLVIRLFKAGQKAGATHFDANEIGEIELEATLNQRKFQGTAEVIYYPSSGREVRRRFTVKVQ